MPADIIVPARAAAWSNANASIITQSGVVAALCRQTTNLASFNTLASSIDGVTLQGLASTAASRLVLLASQTNQVQNGLYVAGNNGNLVSVTGSFDGSGNYVKTGLVVGRLYYFAQSTAGNTITNGTITLTGSGFIAPNASGNLTITGTPLATQLNSMVEASLDRSTLFDSTEELPVDLVVRVDQGSGNKPEYWRLTAQPATVGSSNIVFAQVTTASITPARAANWDDTAATTITPSRATAWDNTPAAYPPVV